MKPNPYLPLILAATSLAAVSSSPAAVISVNFTTATSQAITTNYGIASLGTDVAGWTNLANNVIAATALPFADGTPSPVNLSGSNPGGSSAGNAAYAGTPLNAGKAVYTATPTNQTILSNLNAAFPRGYKVIPYLCGFLANRGASITDGTTTFYYTPLTNAADIPPALASGLRRTTQTTDLGAGLNPFAQYAVFGEPALLTNNTLTLTLRNLYGTAGSYLGGFQIVGVTPADELTRIWKGGQGSNWDTTSLNWTNAYLGLTNYTDGTYVAFNDEATAGSPTVNLTAPHAPASVTVDGTKDYTFTGSGIAGPGGLTKRGPGTLTLANSNSYDGNTTLRGGLVKLGVSGALPDGPGKGDVTIFAGATLELNGFSEGINGLSGAGTVDNNGPAARLTVGLDNDGGTFAGTLQGAVAFAKRGTNRFDLTGISYHTGETLVQEGTLALAPVGNASTLSTLVVSNGATLYVSMTNGTGLYTLGAIQLHGGQALTIDFGDASLTGFSTPLSTMTTLSLTGVSQIAIVGRNFAVGTYTLIGYGSKTGSGTFSPTPLGLPVGMVATVVDTGSAIQLVVTASSIQDLLWTSGDGTWATNAGPVWNFGAAEYKQYSPTLGDAVRFDLTSSGTVTLPFDVHPYSVTVDGNSILTGPGKITGATGLEKVGSTNSFFQLSSANSYTGVTRVSQGNLLVTHPLALGSPAAPTVVSNGATLALSNGITLASEPLILHGDGTPLNTGALRSLDPNNPITVASDITLGASARVRAESGELTLSGAISDGGNGYMLSLHANGTARVRVNSSGNTAAFLRTYGFNLSNGRILFGADNAFPTARLIAGGGWTDLNGFHQTFAGIENGTDFATGALTNSAGMTATLTLNNTNSLATGVPVTGPIAIQKTGPGLQSLNGVNTHSGTTTVNQGVLRIGGDSTGATNTWTVAGGELQGAGTLGGPVTVNAGGTLSPGAGNIGTLTLASHLTLAGTVWAEVSLAGAGARDQVIVGGNAVYGGTLVVTNVGAVPLTSGASFQLFSVAGTKTGNFSQVLVAPEALTGTFDPATGIVTLGSATPPALGYTMLGNGVLQFSWTGPYKLQWQTNSLAVGLGANWVDYPEAGNPVNVTNHPAIPAAFFRLKSL